MAVSKTLVLLVIVLAVASTQSARVKKHVYLAGAYPYVAAVEDDGSYWPGKYPDDPVVPHAIPVVPYPYIAPVYPHAVPIPILHGEDDGSYYPGKYGPENQ